MFERNSLESLYFWKGRFLLIREWYDQLIAVQGEAAEFEKGMRENEDVIASIEREISKRIASEGEQKP
jgi:hypothetical protein